MSVILVIDNDAATSLSVASAVPHAAIVTAGDALEGLSMLRLQRDVGLIVVDLAATAQHSGALCLRLRDEAPQVPILPLIEGEPAPLRRLLRELQFADPLVKPLDLPLVAPAVRAAIQQQPEPVPPSGLLLWAQQQARSWERSARVEQGRSVVVCAAQRRDRIYLRQLLAAAGATVRGEAAGQDVLERLILQTRHGLHQAPIVVTTAAQTAPLAAFAAVQNLPLLAIAPDLTSALPLVHNPHRLTAAWPTLGVVIDAPTDEAAVPLHLACALQRLGHGEDAIPPRLEAPFADTVLSSQEQTTLLLDLQGYSSNAIAVWMKIDASTVRQYRGRIRDKLGIAPGEPLPKWAEQWWCQSLERSSANGH